LKAEGNNRKIETFKNGQRFLVLVRYGFDLAPASSFWNCSDGVVVFVVHFIIANIYFDSDMSKSTNTVVCFDWKTVIYIYVTRFLS
jgi:hypothetical protein